MRKTITAKLIETLPFPTGNGLKSGMFICLPGLVLLVSKTGAKL